MTKKEREDLIRVEMRLSNLYWYCCDNPDFDIQYIAAIISSIGTQVASIRGCKIVD